MKPVTLRIVEGADRGRSFRDLAPPVTVGREEGNSIQLNDERVSRFHLRIQNDQGQLVLTDLESTNGTKVNGEDTRLRILRPGDVISIGRSTLILGTREEINRRLGPGRMEPAQKESGRRGASRRDPARRDPARREAAANARNESRKSPGESDLGLPKNWQEDANYQLELLELDPPQLPTRLSPAQAAQLSEVLEYVHMRLRNLIGHATPETNGQVFRLDLNQWQYLLDIQARLAEYLRQIVHIEREE